MSVPASDIRAAFERNGHALTRGVFDAAAVAALPRDFDGIGRPLVANDKHAFGRRDTAMIDAHPISGETVIQTGGGDIAFSPCFPRHGSMPNRSDTIHDTLLWQLYSGLDRGEGNCAHRDKRVARKGWTPHISRAAAGATH